MTTARNDDMALLDDLESGWFQTVAFALDDLGLGAHDAPTRGQRIELVRSTGLILADVSRAIRIRRAAARLEAE